MRKDYFSLGWGSSGYPSALDLFDGLPATGESGYDDLLSPPRSPQMSIAFRCMAVLLIALLAFAASSAGDKDEAKGLPKGSEKAVAAVRKEFPEAKIAEVAEPKGFGGSKGAGTPLYWTVRVLSGDKKHDLSVTPEGVIIRLPIAVEVKELPKAVGDAVAKAAAGATVRGADKNEIRATMKYVAMEKPQVLQYVITVVKDGKRSQVTMNGTGGGVKVTEIKDEKKAVKVEPEKEKEIEIPKKAARAVAAIKGLYPDAVVKQITTEVFDDGSGSIEILTYEIEFLTKGTQREMVASPEGVIPHLWATIEPKDLPKAVSEALDKAVAGAKVERARAREVRASLRFGALETPKIYYTVRMERDGKDETIKLRPDGTLIKTFEFPKRK
jgi:hypothetical protein